MTRPTGPSVFDAVMLLLALAAPIVIGALVLAGVIPV